MLEYQWHSQLWSQHSDIRIQCQCFFIPIHFDHFESTANYHHVQSITSNIMLCRLIITTLCVAAVLGGRGHQWKQRKRASKQSRQVPRPLGGIEHNHEHPLPVTAEIREQLLVPFEEQHQEEAMKEMKPETEDRPLLTGPGQLLFFVDSPGMATDTLEMPSDVTAAEVVREVFGTRRGVLSFAGRYLADTEILADVGVCAESRVSVLPGAAIPVTVYPSQMSEYEKVDFEPWDTSVLATTFTQFADGLRSQIQEKFEPKEPVRFKPVEGCLFDIIEELRPYIANEFLPTRADDEEVMRACNPDKSCSRNDLYYKIEIGHNRK